MVLYHIGPFGVRLSQGILLWQRIFFWTMVITQVITTPGLRFFWSSADFIKILEVSDFSIGLYVNGTFFAICIQNYGLQGFLISRRPEKSQTWCGDDLGYYHCPKNIRCQSTCLEGGHLLAPAVERVYMYMVYSMGKIFCGFAQNFPLKKVISVEPEALSGVAK